MTFVLRLLRAVLWAALLFLVPLLPGCGGSDGPLPPVDDPPPALEGLIARPGAFSDTLSWRRASIDDFARYRIRRTHRGSLPGAEADSVWMDLAPRLSVDDTTWVDEDVSPGHLYAYEVRTEDLAGQVGDPGAVSARMEEPNRVAIGFEPRRSRPLVGGPVQLSLWIAGTGELHGIVVDLEHTVFRLSCEPGTPFGDPTLAICTGPASGPTGLALSGVRGGPDIEGVSILADLRFESGPDADSVTVLVRSLAREDGTEIEGAGTVLIRSAYWEPEL